MRSFTELKNLFTNLSNNTSTANDSLGGQLINDQHRYLLQRYFDNEKTVTLSTVGGQSLTLTGALAIGATSATLTGSWSYITATQLVNFSSGEQRTVLFTNGSTAITWGVPLTQTATTAISSVGVQDYPIPANVSKIKNGTINVGQLKYSPRPIETRQEWDTITMLPYTSDIPNYFFIYNGKISFFPIPATTGNVITFNYKSRFADLSFADYSTGNIANAGMVAGSTAVTGSATSWSATGKYPTGTDVSYYNLQIRADAPNGDGIWYPISSFTSDTALTTTLPIVNAPNITASTTYKIGQFPLLQEDFHDMLVYGALKVYYSSIKKDPNAFKEYESLYKERLDLLEEYAGTKQVNVDLGEEPATINPNLFMFSQ